MNRVVVTGLGLVTPLGHDVEDVWTRLLEGEVGVTAPRRHGAARPPTIAVGEIAPEVIATPEGSAIRTRRRRGSCRTLFGVAAGADAIHAAGLEPGAHRRAGVILGAGPGVHRPEDVASEPRRRRRVRRRPLRPRGRLPAPGLADPRRGRAAGDDPRPAVRPRGPRARGHDGVLGRQPGAGPRVSSSCSAGEVDWVVAGGSDSQVNPLGLVFFVLLGASASGDVEPAAACRPFDRRRSGLVMGEGAGCAVLESLDHARARGAPILAEVAGYGASMDACRTTAPLPRRPRRRRGDGLRPRRRRLARRRRRLRERARNRYEAQRPGRGAGHPHGVRRARRRRSPSPRARAPSGHLLSGAAGVAFVATALAVQRDAVPPTANLDEPDRRVRPRLRARASGGCSRFARRSTTRSRSAGRTPAWPCKKYVEGDA